MTAGLHTIRLSAPDDTQGFIDALRRLLRAGIPPESVDWEAGDGHQQPLALPPAAQAVGGPSPAGQGQPILLPRAFVAMARTVALHDDPRRFERLHRFGHRLTLNRDHWRDTLHPERLRLERMTREVGREIHKMHAFVRFRPIEGPQGTLHVAWFEPDHHVVRAAAPFFVRRFAAMHWTILTPRGSVRWDRHTLQPAPPADRADAPGPDAGEAVWITYYRSIFNPARHKAAMMRREMPERFWRNLPEASVIDELERSVPRRVHAMVAEPAPPGRHAPHPRRTASGCGASRPGGPVATDPAAAALPAHAHLAGLAQQAARCDRCPFADAATQTVWGEGPADAPLMLVGEQPGDEEDLAGRPFVGPAGRLLRSALTRLGWHDDRVYLTNAVKHFKYVLKGPRRLHKTAAQQEALACADWLEAEIAAVRPRAIVALGATAARSLLGRDCPVLQEAGRWHVRADGIPVLIVPHPAAVLRGLVDTVGWTASLAALGERLQPPGSPGR